MRKISLLLLLVFSTVVFAQTPGITSRKPASKREVAIRQIEMQLEKNTVLEFLKKCILEISRGDKDGKALSMQKYILYDMKIKKYLKYRWFIADTGLSKRWLSDIQKLTEYMYKVRDIVETGIKNNQTQTAETKQAVKYFDVAYKRFVKLVKKPVKVSGKVERRAKVKKVLWQKAMRKKYKIKGKIQEEF